MEILKVENLNKTYGKNPNKVKAVKNVNLTIKEGEFVAIIGKSGSGKSTLLNLLGLLENPDNGKIIIEEKDTTKMTEEEKIIYRRKNIGIIYQAYNLISTLTVKENILLPASLENRTISDKELEEMLKSLGLKEKINQMPNSLSGGEQQRTAIARALINSPKILLADEPTGNLDSKNTNQILKKLKYYNKRYKQTIIMVTHDEALAQKTDRIITYIDGKIVKDEKTNM